MANFRREKYLATMQTLTLTTKPVGVNQRYTISRGRNILSTKYRNAKEALQWEIKSQWQGEPLDDDVTLNIFLYLDSNRSDIDAYIKIVLDALTGTAYKDDKQVTELSVIKMHDPEEPRIVIQVL